MGQRHAGVLRPAALSEGTASHRRQFYEGWLPGVAVNQNGPLDSLWAAAESAYTT
jgi:hypothetical protein